MTNTRRGGWIARCPSLPLNPVPFAFANGRVGFPSDLVKPTRLWASTCMKAVQTTRTSPYRKCRIRSSMQARFYAFISRFPGPLRSDRPADTPVQPSPNSKSAATGTFHLVNWPSHRRPQTCMPRLCTLLRSGTAPRWREPSRRGRNEFSRLSRSWHFRVCPHFSASRCISSSFNN